MAAVHQWQWQWWQWWWHQWRRRRRGESWWHVLHWSRHWQRGSRYLPHSICWSPEPPSYIHYIALHYIRVHYICNILSAGHQNLPRTFTTLYYVRVHYIRNWWSPAVHWQYRVPLTATQSSCSCTFGHEHLAMYICPCTFGHVRLYIAEKCRECILFGHNLSCTAIPSALQ